MSSKRVSQTLCCWTKEWLFQLYWSVINILLIFIQMQKQKRCTSYISQWVPVVTLWCDRVRVLPFQTIFVWSLTWDHRDDLERVWLSELWSTHQTVRRFQSALLPHLPVSGWVWGVCICLCLNPTFTPTLHYECSSVWRCECSQIFYLPSDLLDLFFSLLLLHKMNLICAVVPAFKR